MARRSAARDSIAPVTGQQPGVRSRTRPGMILSRGPRRANAPASGASRYDRPARTGGPSSGPEGAGCPRHVGRRGARERPSLLVI
jgi:hypothetical protein